MVVVVGGGLVVVVVVVWTCVVVVMAVVVTGSGDFVVAGGSEVVTLAVVDVEIGVETVERAVEVAVFSRVCDWSPVMTTTAGPSPTGMISAGAGVARPVLNNAANTAPANAPIAIRP